MTEAKDTVMSEQQRTEIARECWTTRYTFPELVAIRQAEISFRLGYTQALRDIESGISPAGKADD